MVADGMALSSNLPAKTLPEKPVNMEKKASDNAPEKTSKDMTKIGETVRENFEISREALERGLEEVNKNIKIFNTRLAFTIDEPTGKTVIQVFDSESDELIRQYPPGEFLKIAARLNEILGVLLDQKA